ncbi:TIGR03032 family protein [Desulfococcaceae bacterium HSG7]|nr:TIGR03032 family protein [Desulfococcaceae bacterium HSG7]
MTQSPVEIDVSRHFLQWLYEERISLAFTTYQTNRLFLIGLKPDGALSTFERLFDRPMGLHAASERLYMSSRYQLWRFDNILPTGELYDGYDKLFVPRTGHTTGDLDVHDIVLNKRGQVTFVNTLYSCLAVLSDRHSFTPIWQPPFISELIPQDCCHLNGLATDDGEPAYVTSVSRSDVPSGWRQKRHKSGCLTDVRTDEIILSGLSMPHSPRIYRDKLWLLNSGRGEFGYADKDKGEFVPVTFCPGYLRGLAFYKNFALVGLSKPRHERTFSGLDLDQRLTDKDAEPRCGLAIIDLDSGHIAHWVWIEGNVAELYDVQILPEVRRPMALGFKTDEIARIVTFEQNSTVRRDNLSGTSIAEQPSYGQSDEKQNTSAALPKPKSAPRTTAESTAYRFQVSIDMSVAAAIEMYEHLTFPNIRRRAEPEIIHEPLITTVATCQGQFVGMALAEILPHEKQARMLSLFTEREHRRRGIGLRLMAFMEKALTGQGCSAVNLSFRTDWPGAPAVKRILRRLGWSDSKAAVMLCKTTIEQISKAPWVSKSRMPENFTVFPWSELTSDERQTIRQCKDYPAVLNPFQREDRIESVNSLGLRFRGEVVGWLITHRTASDTVEYSAMFIQKKSWHSGLAVPLLAESINRQIAANISYFVFQVEMTNKKMLKFVQRYIRPYLTSVTESHRSVKVLTDRR